MTKRWPFPFCRVIPRRAEDCGVIKVAERLNAMAERSESAHHRSVTAGGSKETRREGNKARN